MPSRFAQTARLLLALWLLLTPVSTGLHDLLHEHHEEPAELAFDCVDSCADPAHHHHDEETDADHACVACSLVVGFALPVDADASTAFRPHDVYSSVTDQIVDSRWMSTVEIRGPPVSV